MKKVIIAFLIALVFTSCINDEAKEINQAKVDAYFTNAVGEKLYLSELNAEDIVVIDSIVIAADGKLHFEFTPSENPQLYVLRSEKFGQSVTLIVGEGDELMLEGDLPLLNENYSVQNSEGSIRVKELSKIINTRMANVDRFYATYRDNPDSLEMEELRSITDSLLQQNQIAIYNELRAFIKKDPASLSSLLALYSRFGRSSILDYRFDSDMFLLVSDSLIRRYPNSSHSLKLHEKVLELKNADKLKAEREQALEEGKKFPEIILNDKDGKALPLYDIKSKLCVVYVWESKSKPSWDGNAILKEIYESYNSKGLEIYSISFDTDKLAWANYCFMDKLVWKNVIGFPSEKQLLNAEDNMPRFFLLDANHTIIAKDPLPEEWKEIVVKNLNSDPPN